ncbi:MAG: ATP-binding protein [Campylobacteraceae bacterium]
MKEFEFGFYAKNALEFPLDESIKIVDEKDKNEVSAIISNSKEIKAEVYAPEIDFYVRNSNDNLADKIKAVKTLYDARLSAFDLAQFFDYEQEVGNLLLVVSSEEPTVLKKLKESGFKAILLKPEQVAYISGHLGALDVGVMIDGEINEVKTDQMLWINAPEFALEQSGVYDFKDIEDAEIVEKLKAKVGNYKYKNYISYDPNICQYHERRVDTCGKCADICPTVAIVKDDGEKHLIFSHIDCESCGGCISVCPSGALDYTQMPRLAFYEIARMYKNKIALVIPRKMEKFLDSLHVKLPEHVLPLDIEGEKYLHEAHFLSLLQESGAQVVFYTDFVSKGSRDAIFMLNQT